MLHRKSVAVAALGTALLAVTYVAGATTITYSYDSVVAGSAPQTGVAPWLTVAASDSFTGAPTGTTLALSFSGSVLSPEFITQIFFNLTGTYSPTILGNNWIGSDPTFTMGTCNGKDPAGTGPWQMCVGFGTANAQRFNSADGTLTVYFSGLSVGNFVIDNSGYSTVAHVQGINNSCSGWIGDNGTAPNNTSGAACTPTPVPEPGSLSLIGLGLLGLGLGRRRVRVH